MRARQPAWENAEITVSRSFMACLEESDSIWRDVPDTLERRVIRARMTPYLERLSEMADEIVP